MNSGAINNVSAQVMDHMQCGTNYFVGTRKLETLVMRSVNGGAGLHRNKLLFFFLP